jgi:hypothetical protein
MTLEQFEKEAAEFALEQGWIPQQNPHSMNYSFFTIGIGGSYKSKALTFKTTCEQPHISFIVRGTNYNDLFNKALKKIKETTKKEN